MRNPPRPRHQTPQVHLELPEEEAKAEAQGPLMMMLELAEEHLKRAMAPAKVEAGQGSDQRWLYQQGDLAASEEAWGRLRGTSFCTPFVCMNPNGCC